MGERRTLDAGSRGNCQPYGDDGDREEARSASRVDAEGGCGHRPRWATETATSIRCWRWRRGDRAIRPDEDADLRIDWLLALPADLITPTNVLPAVEHIGPAGPDARAAHGLLCVPRCIYGLRRRPCPLTLACARANIPNGASRSARVEIRLAHA